MMFLVVRELPPTLQVFASQELKLFMQDSDKVNRKKRKAA